MAALQRTSLPAQAAAFLRQGIREGRWSGELPSEAELCRELSVSRVTLRRALAPLIREGWIKAGGRGRRHRVGRQSKTQRRSSGRIVRMLSPHSQFSLGSFLHGVLDTIVERLGAAGIRVEYEHRPRLFTRHSPGELARLTSLPDTAAWALLFATESMQRWYAERGVPCVVIGRAYPGVELPCVYPDTEAPARHAAGLFVQRGHLELVYFIAEQTSLNDRLGADAFAQEGMRLGANVRIITHPRSASALSRRILAVLAEEPRPTAFFSGCPEHCLTILCHLFNEGFRVPTDASIISGQEDEFLQFALPKFARYRSDGMKLGRKAATMLLNLIRHGRGSRRTISILPEFIPGGTLGRRMPTPAH